MAKKVLFLVLAAAVVAYIGSFRCGWHLDDRHTITENESIPRLGSVAANAPFSNRGLTDLTFAVDWALYGDHPAGFRIFNLALHLGNGLLLFWLAALLIPDRSRAGFVGITAAALFLLHPLATQTVTYIVQRHTSLATFFYLLSVAAYLRGRGRSRAFLLLSWAAALAGVRSKEIVLTLPLTLLVVELLFPSRPSPRRLLAIVPHLLIVSIIPLTLVAGRLTLGESLAEAMSRGSRETGNIGRLAYLATQVHVVVTYIRVLVLPVGQTIDYDYPIRTDPFELITAAKALFLFLLLASAIRFRRRHPVVSFGFLWFAATLLVESSFFPIRDVIFEHRTYLPSAGFFLGVAALLSYVKYRRAARGAVLALSVVLAVLTMARNEVWRDEIALWSDAVQKAPGKARPHANLAYAYLDGGDRARAIEHLSRSVHLDPTVPEEMVTLAEVLYEEGEGRRAEELLRKALLLRPGYGRAVRNLAFLLYQRGSRTEAVALAEEFARENPEGWENWIHLARMLLDMGEIERGEEAAERAARMDGGRGEGMLLLSLAAARRGDGEEAITRLLRWKEAAEGGAPEDLERIARTLLERGDEKRSLAALGIASGAFPREPLFLYYQAAILVQRGGSAEAIPLLRKAISLAPAERAYVHLLIRALDHCGQTDEALREANALLRSDPNDPEARAWIEKLRSGTAEP